MKGEISATEELRPIVMAPVVSTSLAHRVSQMRRGRYLASWRAASDIFRRQVGF